MSSQQPTIGDDISSLLENPTVPAQRLPEVSAPEPTPSAPTGPPLSLAVVWGDLVGVEADIHIVGHYQGVLPASAEMALDRAISMEGQAGNGSQRGVIAEYTRRRWLIEQLGVLTYFPGAPKGHVRQAAVVGLGRPATLNERRAVQVYQSLVGRLAALGSIETIATVLIGSGAGNLSIEQAGAALIEGVSSAIARLPPGMRLKRLVVVEYDRLRADRIQTALQGAIERASGRLTLDPAVQIGSDGHLPRQAAVEMTARMLAELAFNQHDPVATNALDLTLGKVAESERQLVREQLQELAEQTSGPGRPGRPQPGAQVPTRLSVIGEGGSLRWGAITDRATVPERLLPIPPTLINQLVTRLDGPSDTDLGRLAEGLSRLLVPVDLQSMLNSEGPIVLEVDRMTARLQWEVLVDLLSGNESQEPLAVTTPITRQLRTLNSRLPSASDDEESRRVLVIGNPGSPSAGRSLPGARVEAAEVAASFPAPQWDVRVFIGAPSAATNESSVGGEAPADLVDVLFELMSGRYQLVHFAGHGTYDPSAPNLRSGWLFEAGLLTSQYLTNLSRAPRIVLANACYSSRIESGSEPEQPSDSSQAAEPSIPGTGAELVATLAEQFMNVGVVHYIGSAWKVHDPAGAVFAKAFYDAVLKPNKTIGDAVMAGRRALWKERALYGTDWAAYQHYGDPNDVLVQS